VSRWADFIGAEVTDVVMHYRPWADDGGYWCSRITLFFDSCQVDLLLGEEDNEGCFVRAADTIAVVFPPAPLPEWERDES
jgi:hypothetical protein